MQLVTRNMQEAAGKKQNGRAVKKCGKAPSVARLGKVEGMNSLTHHDTCYNQTYLVYPIKHMYLCMSLTGTFILPSPQKRLAAYLSTPISTHPENRKQNKQNGFSKFSICSHKKSPWTSRKTNKKAKQGLFVLERTRDRKTLAILGLLQELG
ncbi:hypothetical protein HL42_0319 [Trichophyton rubrum]|nr:hypothetical protein HL42_0319 [Trichophyton rubrum]